MKRDSYLIMGVAVLALAGAGAVLWRYLPGRPVVPVPSAPPLADTAAAPAPAAAPEPAIRHPLDLPVTANSSAPLPDIDVALTGLFGRETVLSMFQLQDFPRRLVATVDNLGRARASARLWPVNPVGGRFIVEKRDGAESIGAVNEKRYTPYVLLIEKVDLRQAVAVYVRLYPLLQQAYEDIGYPKRYFNDRLVEVIDQLLASPEPGGPLTVHLPAINGPVQPERPWVLYEFDDPALQSLSAGQKILLRMGPQAERRVKSRLVELRRLVTAGTAPR